MTRTGPALDRHVSHLRRKGRDWGRALDALRRLTANKEDTAQVYAIMNALNGNAYEVDYVRLLSTPEGGRIAYERVELADRLMDEALRASFPPGSVGAAYVEFLETEHISVQGLIDESHKGIPPAELDQHHPYVWFFRRFRDIHDILHVLTGYGRDSLGEICLLAFSYQETHDLGRAVMAYSVRAAGRRSRAPGPDAAGGLRRRPGGAAQPDDGFLGAGALGHGGKPGRE